MKCFRYRDCPPGEQGSITPILALALVALVGAMAVSIDVGQLFLVKNDLQNVADAAALAGAKKLLQDKLPDGAPDGVPEVYCDEAIQAAIAVANKNLSFGSDAPVKLTADNVKVGKWNLSTKQFDREGCSADPIQVNAVQVTVNRDGTDNSKVSTFFGSVLGVGEKDKDEDGNLIEAGPTKLSVGATSVAMLGLAGTSSVDIPFTIPADYAAGGGVASNGFERMLDRLAPVPAYAASTHYTWKDQADGGASSSPQLVTNRATWTVAKDTESAGAQAYYAMKKYLQGTERFPQKKVGDKLYPATEHIYGQYLKDYFNWMKTRWTNKRNPTTLKWRVTVPVFKTTPVTSSLPQNSWTRFASILLPGVSQAHACTLIPTPAVYTQGFATIDITNVVVNSTCVTTQGTPQRDNTNSCRRTCYMEFDVPTDQNTVSTDKGSNPIPFQKDYKDMTKDLNPTGNDVGVFASVPRLVK